MVELDDFFGAMSEVALKGLKFLFVILIAFLIAYLFFKPADSNFSLDSLKDSLANGIAGFGQAAVDSASILPFHENSLALFIFVALAVGVIFLLLYKLAGGGSKAWS
ncbi:Uncharacterised protein [Candidatus Burarchaeum australiense]|nr:Uncharacterised protein [Candidatus Burarchaeum australiense]